MLQELKLLLRNRESNYIIIILKSLKNSYFKTLLQVELEFKSPFSIVVIIEL